MAKLEIRPEHQALVAARFVNVTGLHCYNGGQFDFGKSLGIICPNPDFKAGTGYNNGRSAVYLSDGTVWLRMGSGYGTDGFGCSGGAYVPCSNGEDVTVSDLWCRITDPYWNGGEAMNYSNHRIGPVRLGYLNSPATGEEIKKHPEFLAFCERVKKDSK